MTHLLDSSAWLTHLFGEPGVDEVGQLLSDRNAHLTISAISIAEVFARLKTIGKESQWSDVWAIYSELYSSMIAADEEIAHRAVNLRKETAERLPKIDGLNTSTALFRGLTLVHREPHMTAIRDPEFRQMRLSD